MLSPGTRISVYEIGAQLGAGGMGEVYRARDTRLQRDVALKVLPEAFARNAERMARFEREARMLASLNHPNIAAIYGLEESGPIRALVMELVEGPTLADRILTAGKAAENSAIPVDEALAIARQIADALEYAHDHNVIHRDLKPANIKVKADGAVKVLDFGLAKALSYEPESSDFSNSPTLSMAATRQGVILGTASYMAPEQAQGKQVDRRADVWAFGCVLYEMMTGKQAFHGEDVTDILASVLKSDPALDALPADTSPAIRTLLRRCLEKNLRRRLGHISEARILIEDVLSGASPGNADLPIGAVASTPPLWRRAIPIAIAVCLAAALAGLAAWMLKPAPRVERPISRFVYDFPADQQFRNFGRNVMAFSPDGARFVYNTSKGFYLRSMDQLEARLIPGTEGPLSNPIFSPDGQWVGYYQAQVGQTQGQIKKIAISGGAPVPICPATNPFGANWAPDNTILFGQADGIHRVSANGGTSELIIKSEAAEQFDAPQLLPGGKWVLFTIGPSSRTSWDEGRIVVQSLETKERRDVWKGGSDARYLPTGHILYALADNLFAVPFDLNSLKSTGGAVLMVQGAFRAVGPNTSAANYGVSNDGSFVYVTGTSVLNRLRTLVWVDRQGKEEPIKAPPRAYMYPRVSPDGTRVALDIRDQENDIWVWDLARETLFRLTFDPGFNRSPAWTPDGKRLAFSGQRGNAENIYWQAADGSGMPEPLTDTPNISFFPTSFSPDGSQLIFSQALAPNDIFRVKTGGDRKPETVLQTSFDEQNAELSPDGRWLAYQSNESGRDQVYVRPYPDLGAGKWQISTAGGTRPAWNPRGGELFYTVFKPGATALMSVRIEPGAAFKAGTPQALFQGDYLNPALSGRQYSVSPDGRRLLVTKTAATISASAPPPQIVIVQNWLEELKRRAPAGK